MNLLKNNDVCLTGILNNVNNSFDIAIKNLSFNNSNVLCLACGDCEKEYSLLKSHYKDINMMICLDTNSDKVKKAINTIHDDKIQIIVENMDNITEKWIDKLYIDTIVLFGFSFKPFNLLSVLLFNKTYFNFLKAGYRIIVEPSMGGYMFCNDTSENYWMNFDSAGEMFSYINVLNNIFNINVYNNRLLEIKEPLLDNNTLFELKNNSKYFVNQKHLNISSI